MSHTTILIICGLFLSLAIYLTHRLFNRRIVLRLDPDKNIVSKAVPGTYYLTLKSVDSTQYLNSIRTIMEATGEKFSVVKRVVDDCINANLLHPITPPIDPTSVFKIKNALDLCGATVAVYDVKNIGHI